MWEGIHTIMLEILGIEGTMVDTLAALGRMDTVVV